MSCEITNVSLAMSNSLSCARTLGTVDPGDNIYDSRVHATSETNEALPMRDENRCAKTLLLASSYRKENTIFRLIVWTTLSICWKAFVCRTFHRAGTKWSASWSNRKPPATSTWYVPFVINGWEKDHLVAIVRPIIWTNYDRFTSSQPQNSFKGSSTTTKILIFFGSGSPLRWVIFMMVLFFNLFALVLRIRLWPWQWTLMAFRFREALNRLFAQYCL